MQHRDKVHLTMAIFSTLSPPRSAGFRVLLGCAVTAVGLCWSSPALAVVPTISNADPTPVTYGVTTSRSITIYGANFEVGSTITVGSLSGPTVAGTIASAATPFVWTSATQVKFYWANTSLAPRSYDVTVANPTSGEAATLSAGFVVAPPQPTIDSTSPNPVTYGVTASSSVTIYGANFVLGSTITVGSLTGPTVSGTIANATVPFVFVNSGQLKFYWSNASLAPGSYTVQVTNTAESGGLSGMLVGGFVVSAAHPSVSNLSLPSVTYGVTGNSSITIYGSNFVLGATITVGSLTGPTVSGTIASATVPFAWRNSGELKFWWANTSLPPGTYAVTVTNPVASGGLSASLAAGFVVVAPRPTISNADPTPVTYGVDLSRSITIYGENFVLGSTITVGSLTGTTVAGTIASATVPFVWRNSGELKFWWANTSLPPGTYAVTVTNPGVAGGLAGSLPVGFTVTAPQPTISNADPTPVTYGVDLSRSITIYGTNFVLGSTITVGSLTGPTVSGTIASATVPFAWRNSGELKFWWPNTSLAPGAYTVTVTNPAVAGGLAGSLAAGFTVAPPQPTIESVQPSTVEFGVTASGPVTITGTNFFEPIGSDLPLVEIGNFSCRAVTGAGATASERCVYVSNRRIEIYREPTSVNPGVHAVRVTNPQYAGAVTGELAGGFTVTAPKPRIETIKPAVVTAGITSSRAIDIVGTYDPAAHLEFLVGATVTVTNTNPATATGNLRCENVVAATTPNPTTPCVFVGGGLIRFYWDSAQAAASTLLGPGTYDVTVTNPAARGGLRDTKPAAFRVTLTPEILGIEPVTGIGAGARGAVVTVTSSGFGVGTTVAVAGASPDPTSGQPIVLKSSFRANAAEDGGSFVIDVADGTASGMRTVTLTTADGAHAFTCPDPSGPAATCKAGLMINPAPVMTSIAPTLGAGATGRTLAIAGDRFVAKTTPSAPETAVLFPSGVTGTCTVTSATAIACTNVVVAPETIPDQYAVVVVNPDDGRASGLLRINAAPVFVSISPTQGPAGSMTIAGTGFQAGVTVVMDAEIAVAVGTGVTATAIPVTLTVSPTAAPGYHPLTIMNPDGGSVNVPQAFSVGTPPPDALSALATYGQQGQAKFKYRRSSGAGWSSQSDGPALTAPPIWQVMKANPVRDERILAVVDEQRHLTLHVWNGQAWMGNLQATASSGLPRPTQTVDVAFEQVTGGKGLAVYALSGSLFLRYRTWDPTAMSWSAEDYVTGPIEMMGTPLWVRLETRPTTDEILLVYGDSANAVGAAVWRGATKTWTDPMVLTTDVPSHDAPLFDVAFERATRRALVAWASASTPSAPHYRIWNGGWGAEATAPSASDAPAKTITALRLAADPAATSNRIALAASSGTPVGTLATLTWDGVQSQWSAPADIVATRLVMDGGGRAFDLGWEGSSGDQIAVYASRGSSRGVYKTRSSVPGSAWSALPSALPALAADPQTTLTPPCLIDNTFCVTIAGTTLYVASTAGFPPAGVVAVDAELIRYTSMTATSLSGLTRGAFGTTATDHASGAAVALRSFPAWVELAGVSGLDNLALALFDIAGRVTLAQWDGSAWGGALEAQTQGSGFVSSVAGRAVAVTLAQHLAWITPPPPVTDTTSPATPTLAAGTPAVTSVPLSWVAVGDDGLAGGMVSRYELRRTRGTDSTIQTISATQLPGVTETMLVTGLQGGTTYTFELRAQDEVPNASGWSAPVTVTTVVDQPPAAITLGATAATPNAISIQWTVLADDSGPLAGYDVRYATATPFTFETAIPYTAHAPQTVGATATLVLDGLVPETTYYIGVKAMDAIGQWGALSNVLNARTADAVLTDTNAPAPISDLTVFAASTTSTSLLLKWTATGDDGLVGTAGAYEVRYATGPLTTTNFAQGTLVAAFPPGHAGSAQELAVSGLSSNTTYYFAIDVVDDGGNHSGLSPNVTTGRTALRRGYNLVSVPLVLTANDTADMVFGDDVGLPVYAYRWKSSGSLATDGCYLGTIAIPGFTVCGLLGSVQTGAGYFLYSSSGTQAVLDAVGTAVPDSPYPVPLDLGFNMVGNPYSQEIALASVQVKRGSSIVSYADAVTNGWVGRAIYIYDGVTTQAYDLTDVPRVVLKPWNGVWVQSRVSDAVLVFVRP